MVRRESTLAEFSRILKDMRFIATCLLLLFAVVPARAGLYYSGEIYADLPAQWRGFLLDHRLLRMIAVAPTTALDASPLRVKYQQEAAMLERKTRTADDTADLGAIYVRLGVVDKAIELLRAGQRDHPNHFAISANLGTAWQLRGDLSAAAESLRIAVKLAPGRWLGTEELHLKLVLGRLRAKRPGNLDDLFGVVMPLNEAERKKLPAGAAARVQQLALWLPNDGLLLWQLAELADSFGDVRSAAAMMEGCVQQFNLGAPDVRRRRQILKEAVEQLPKATIDKAGHQPDHAGSLAFRSRRPLASQTLELPLPPIDATGVNPVPWDLFGNTVFAGRFPPRFPKYLQDLDGKQVSLVGFAQPLRDADNMTAFLFIESPVGCWYCEMPDLTAIIHVSLPTGETTRYQRGLQRVTGRLSLNRDEPEDFLFGLRDARIAPVD